MNFFKMFQRRSLIDYLNDQDQLEKIILKKDLYPLFVDIIQNGQIEVLKEKISQLTYLNKIYLYSNLIFNQFNVDNIILFEDLDIKVDRQFKSADFERFNFIQQMLGDMMCISIGDRNYTFIYETSKKTFVQAWTELHHFFLSPPSYVDFIMAINRIKPQLLGIDHDLDDEKLKSLCYSALSLGMPIIDVIQNKHLQEEINISNICFE